MMKKYYELPEIEMIRLQEEPIRTSPIFGGDEEDDWGLDVWD